MLVMQHCYLTPANAAASVCTTGVKDNESRLSEHIPITEVMKSRCSQLSHCAPGGCMIVCITVTLEASSLLFYITASPQYNSSKKEYWKISSVTVKVCDNLLTIFSLISEIFIIFLLFKMLLCSRVT